MRDKIPPIVDADGNDYRVRARQVIGAEHLEAALQWTDRYHDAATRDHYNGVPSGAHKKAYHAWQVLRIQQPVWSGSTLNEPGEVLGESEFVVIGSELRARRYTVEEWREEHGSSPFTVSELGQGAFRVSASGVSTVDYERTRIVVAGMPRVGLNAGFAPFVRTVRVFNQQATQFSLRFMVYDGEDPGWHNHGERIPLTVIVYNQAYDT